MYSHIPHPDLDINQIPHRISEVRPRPRWGHQLVHRSFLIYQHFEGLDLAVLTGTKQRRAVLGITCVDIHCPQIGDAHVPGFITTKWSKN